MIKKILLLFLCSGTLWAARSLVLIQSQHDRNGGHLFFSGVCVDKNKGLVLAPYNQGPFGCDSFSVNKSPCDVVAVDRLHGICILRVKKEEALSNVQSAYLGSSDELLHPVSISEDGTTLKGRQAVVSRDPSVPIMLSPLATVYLHETSGQFSLGTLLCNVRDEVFAMVVSGGVCVLQAHMRALLKRAIAKVEGTYVEQKEYVLPSCAFLSFSKNKACKLEKEVILSAKERFAPPELEVGDVILQVNGKKISEAWQIPVSTHLTQFEFIVKRDGVEKKISVPLTQYRYEPVQVAILRNSFGLVPASQELSFWSGCEEGEMLLFFVDQQRGWSTPNVFKDVNLLVQGDLVRTWQEVVARSGKSLDGSLAFVMSKDLSKHVVGPRGILAGYQKNWSILLV